MSDFLIAYRYTMGVEGFYANNPKDKGGETWKGIAYKKNPDWNGWLIIHATIKAHPANFETVLKADAKLEALVQSFYKLNYWDINQLDKFSNQTLANEMFDTGVNMGRGIAGQFLQKSLNVLNLNGRLYKDLTVDGNVGVMTINTMAKLNDYPRLNKTFSSYKRARYLNLCAADPEQEIFYRSWLGRCA